MKNEYTDEQIKKAILKMPMMNLSDYVAQWELELFRQFLDALPEPESDGWQAKGAEVVDVADVRIGDRVLLKSVEGSLYEVTITSITTTHEVMLRWNDGRIYESSIERAYLFNRPVQHPDPEEHPVIIIRGGDIYDGIPMPQDAMWTGTSYESRTHSFQPGDITDWEPADIVAKEVKTDE